VNENFTPRRFEGKLNDVKAGLQQRMHEPIPEPRNWLETAVRGHIRYSGVPMNSQALRISRFQVGRLWHGVLLRRSQTSRVPWDPMRHLSTHCLPLPSVCHPTPCAARASSPRVRADAGSRSPGPAEGVHDPYSNSLLLTPLSCWLMNSCPPSRLRSLPLAAEPDHSTPSRTGHDGGLGH
jgi:hypothetical protein